MVGGVVFVVGAEVEDGLSPEVAEGHVVGAAKGVLVDVHDEVVVVVPMLVAAGAITSINAEVHGGLQDVTVHVVQHTRDGDVLNLGVNVRARPSVVGKRIAVLLDGGPGNAHHVHVDVKSKFLVLGQASLAVVVGKRV